MKRRDYYEILEISVKATPDEIKQAYRKQAIKWHPDKNPSEEAKERFQEIGEAYQVLSDPNERSWYDHHKDQILRTGEAGLNENDEKYEDILTYGLDIWQYFDRHCYKDYEDAEGDFYSVYRRVFEILKAEEEKAKHSNPDLDDQEYYESIGGKSAPGFGDSKTSAEKVLEFYSYWENFSTYKTFAWKDLYNPNEAGNRQIKRLIEKDNKKERQKEKKKYLDTIKELVNYMKKRDPRYQDYIKSAALEKQKKAEEQRKKDEEKKKELEERKRKHREEEAERYRQEYEQQKAQGLIEEEYVEAVHHEDWFCEICDKEFKSENQLENHKQSKAHSKKLKEFMQEMMLDEEREAYENELEKAREEKGNDEPSRKSKKKKKKNKTKKAQEDEENEDNEEEDTKKEPEKTKINFNKNKKNGKKHEKEKSEKEEEEEIEEPDDDLDFGQFVQKKPQGNKKKKEVDEKKELSSKEDSVVKENDIENNQADSVEEKKENENQEEKAKANENKEEEKDEEDEDGELNTAGKKLGKAKLKRLKKQEKVKQQALICNVCKQSFDTRNKLFQHVKESKHEMKIV